MNDVKINRNGIDIYWVVGLSIEALSQLLEVKLSSNPDSDDVSLIITFRNIGELNITFSDDARSDYIPSYLGLLTDNAGKYILTIDECEIVFCAKSYEIVEM